VGLCTVGGAMLFGVGVAWANVVTYSLLCAGAYLVSQRAYPIPFETARLIKVVGAAVGLFAASTVITAPTPLLDIAVKSLIVGAFPVILGALSFVDMRERRWLGARVQGLVGRMRLPSGAR
jgi:hypothetical protein